MNGIYFLTYGKLGKNFLFGFYVLQKAENYCDRLKSEITLLGLPLACNRFYSFASKLFPLETKNIEISLINPIFKKFIRYKQDLLKVKKRNSKSQTNKHKPMNAMSMILSSWVKFLWSWCSWSRWAFSSWISWWPDNIWDTSEIKFLNLMKHT